MHYVKYYIICSIIVRATHSSLVSYAHMPLRVMLICLYELHSYAFVALGLLVSRGTGEDYILVSTNNINLLLSIKKVNDLSYVCTL